MLFDDNSAEILAALENAKERGLESVGETATGHAQDDLTRQGAVDTGRLRNSIGYDVDEDDVYVGVKGASGVDYGAYVELGTGKYSTVGGTSKESWVYQDEFGKWHMGYPMKARPFIVPAARDHTAEYRDILIDSLENA